MRRGHPRPRTVALSPWRATAGSRWPASAATGPGAGHSLPRREGPDGPAPLPRRSQDDAVAERNPLEGSEGGASLVENDVCAEILEGRSDPVPQPLLVGDRGLTRLHLHEEVDVTTFEIIAYSRAEETDRRGGAKDRSHRNPDRLDLVGLQPHGSECTPRPGRPDTRITSSSPCRETEPESAR